jgi:hypothetical protein
MRKSAEVQVVAIISGDHIWRRLYAGVARFFHRHAPPAAGVRELQGL